MSGDVFKHGVNGICWCCMDQPCSKDMWKPHSWMEHQLVCGDMIYECFNITVPKNANICELCIPQLFSALAFKRKIAVSQVKLQAHNNADNPIVKCEAVENCNQVKDDVSTDTDQNECEETMHSLSQHNKKKDGRKLRYIQARLNVALILENSTITPFRFTKGYFNCFYCCKHCIDYRDVKNHILEDHNNINAEKIMKSILRPKNRVSTDMSDIKCKICYLKLDNLQDLIKHLTVKHDKKFKIDAKVKPQDCIIGYDFSNEKFKCIICKREFLFFKTLANHMNEHTSNYICDVCGKCFLFSERLRAHSQMHLNLARKCLECGKICPNVGVLNSHIRYQHKKICFFCTLCNEKFTNFKQRAQHLKEVHGKSIDLQCKLCPKIFKTPSSLTDHIKNFHLKEKKEARYACKECPMKFISKGKLHNHCISHSGERNFECDLCHKKYSRAKTLSEHMKIHFNDKRWCCKACGSAFVQKCSLKNHIRVHHGENELEQLVIYKKPLEDSK